MLVAFIGSFVIVMIIACIGIIICCPLAIVRAAINGNLSKSQKTWWILGQLFFTFPVSLIYLIFVEKSKTLRIFAIISALVCLAGAVSYVLVPQSVKLPAAHAASCGEAVVQSDWFKQDDQKTHALITNLKAADEKTRQMPNLNLLEKLVWDEIIIKISIDEAEILNCKLDHNKFEALLASATEGLESGKIATDIQNHAIDADYVTRWHDNIINK